ncbi:hypothetical protein [Desemzia sp. FAM 23989]|uniref:hypothetical protein n=1 Tax=Desemzia sp. FAM 23989 TaxID=3259523 RepID=UPI0038864DA1
MNNEVEELMVSLYEGNNKWYKLPIEFKNNANAKNTNSANNKEMYYTTDENKKLADYVVSDEIHLIIVGRYEWEYYYDEDSYDLRDGYFISFATPNISNSRLDPENVYTVDDKDIEPIKIGIGREIKYLSIQVLFDKAKRNALDITSFINNFLKKSDKNN